MMERFNVIIASENGVTKSFVMTRKKFLFLSICILLAITIVSFGSLFTVGFSLQNTYLNHRMAVLKTAMQKTNKINAGFEARLATLIREHNDEVARLKAKNQELVTNLQTKSNHMIADLKMQNLQQKAAFHEEKQQLISTVVSQLKERSELIATVMRHIGVKLKKFKSHYDVSGSGGPFIAIESNHYSKLLNKADRYLQALRTLPLGQPIHGEINSPYGPRVDPINHEASFHPGIDISGYVGEKIRATADGKVVLAHRDGGYGKFILINHGNGYVTGYGHLSRFMVTRGEHVLRGQVIGYVGDTGRSTGPHLHYEIRIHNKTVDPYNYYNFVKISRSIVRRKE